MLMLLVVACYTIPNVTLVKHSEVRCYKHEDYWRHYMGVKPAKFSIDGVKDQSPYAEIYAIAVGDPSKRARMHSIAHLAFTGNNPEEDIMAFFLNSPHMDCDEQAANRTLFDNTFELDEAFQIQLCCECIYFE